MTIPNDGIASWFCGYLHHGALPLQPTDEALTLGRGVFETFPATDGRPVFLARHYRRLVSGCERMHLTPPHLDAIERGIAGLLKEHPYPMARFRLSIAPTWWLLSASPWTAIEGQASIVTCPWHFSDNAPIAGLKSLSYAAHSMAQQWAKDQGATDALILNTKNEVMEVAFANLFIVQNGVLLTPPLESGCLPGVTRAILLELSHQHSLPCAEKMLTITDIATADEVFLTSSMRGLQSVASLNGIPLPIEGKVTETLRLLYQQQSLSCETFD